MAMVRRIAIRDLVNPNLPHFPRLSQTKEHKQPDQRKASSPSLSYTVTAPCVNEYTSRPFTQKQHDMKTSGKLAKSALNLFFFLRRT